MIVTAEQAAALPDPFVVDGEASGQCPEQVIVPPKVWADLDQPCETCFGEGLLHTGGTTETVCPVCDGTGRHVEDAYSEERYGEGRITLHLGLFTVQVLEADRPDSHQQYLVICTKVEP